MVYGQNTMSEGTLRQWCRMFKDEWANKMFTMKSEVIGWPSVVSDDSVQTVDQKIYERQQFTISELSCEFPQISHAVLYEISTVRLGYHKLCATWASASTFLEQYHKDGDEFLNHIIQVTDDETWVSFVNVETKE
jgi:hypothetical protein